MEKRDDVRNLRFEGLDMGKGGLSGIQPEFVEQESLSDGRMGNARLQNWVHDGQRAHALHLFDLRGMGR